MNLRQLTAPRHIWLDGVLLVIVLAVFNAILAPRDIGWLGMNPTPYLILPILLGGRYGFGPGVGSGLLAILGIAGGRVLTGRAVDVPEVLAESPMTFVGLIVAGGLAGELWLYFRRRIAQFETTESGLRAKLRKLDGDALILREAKDELDRITAARDGEISSLDAELRRLYACAATELPDAILSLLKRQARVTDAALYRKNDDEESGTIWHRFGLMGRDDQLPETLDVEAHEIANQALLVRGLVTLPEILGNRQPEGNDLLIAAPLLGLEDETKALLIVAGMPFIAFNSAGADLIDLVCNWSGGVMELSEGAEGRYRIVSGRETQKVFFEHQFLHQIQLAWESCKRHRLPSSLVELAIPSQSADKQSQFEQVVLGAVRSGDFVCHPASPYPALQVLLPLAGERGTDIFIDRCTQFCVRHGVDPSTLKVRRVDLTAAESVEAVMAEFSTFEGDQNA